MTDVFFAALRLATLAHDGQWRKGANGTHSPPYITHCIEVTEMITVQGGVRAPAVQAVALLHDTIEDTTVTYDELLKVFGIYVADSVKKLTIPESVKSSTEYSKQKHKFQMKALEDMDRFTKMIKFADKTCNVRDLVRYPPGWSVSATRAYAKNARELCDAVRSTTSLPEDLLELHDEIFARFDAVHG